MTAPAATTESFFTVLEFAGVMKVDKTVVYRWIKERVIKAINVGSAKRPRLRVAASQLAAAEKALEVKP